MVSLMYVPLSFTILSHLHVDGSNLQNPMEKEASCVREKIMRKTFHVTKTLEY